MFRSDAQSSQLRCVIFLSFKMCIRKLRLYPPILPPSRLVLPFGWKCPIFQIIRNFNYFAIIVCKKISCLDRETGRRQTEYPTTRLSINALMITILGCSWRCSRTFKYYLSRSGIWSGRSVETSAWACSVYFRNARKTIAVKDGAGVRSGSANPKPCQWKPGVKLQTLTGITGTNFSEVLLWLEKIALSNKLQFVSCQNLPFLGITVKLVPSTWSIPIATRCQVISLTKLLPWQTLDYTMADGPLRILKSRI